VRLLFGVAMFIIARFGVASEISSTRPTWLHAETVGMWMWKHVSFVFLTVIEPHMPFLIYC
jgi:hypothetical protein